MTGSNARIVYLVITRVIFSSSFAFEDRISPLVVDLDEGDEMLSLSLVALTLYSLYTNVNPKN